MSVNDGQNNAPSFPGKIGKYTIHTALEQTIEAQVFLASDDTGKQVKLNLTSEVFCQSESRAIRFLREQKVLLEMNHPNVASVFDCGSFDGRPWFASEIDPGQTLEQRVGTGPLDPLVAIDYMCQVCRGLEAAFKKNIFHGAITPSTVVLTLTGVVEIGGFGLVETDRLPENPEETLSLSHYTAPDYIRGDSIDYRVDMYSLGVTFYYLLAKCLPYPGNEIHVLVTGGKDTHVPLLHQKFAKVPVSLSSTIGMLMSSRAEARFQNYGDLSKHLISVRQSILGGAESTLPSGKNTKPIDDVILPQVAKHSVPKDFKKLNGSSEKGKGQSTPLIAAISIFLLVFIIIGAGVIFYYSGVASHLFQTVVSDSGELIKNDCQIELKGSPAGSYLTLFYKGTGKTDNGADSKSSILNRIGPDGEPVKIGSVVERLLPGKYVLKNADNRHLDAFSKQIDLTITNSPLIVTFDIKSAKTDVEFASEPSDAAILIDSIDTGKRTPCTINDVSMVSHQIRFEKNVDGKPLFWEGDITIGPGLKKGMAFKIGRGLIPLTVPLIFTTEPKGADVSQIKPKVTSVSIGSTFSPLKTRLSPGAYTFQFSSDGYGVVTKDVTLVSKLVEVHTKLPYCSIELRLHITPPDAIVELKELDIQGFERKLFLVPGQYSLIVTKKGFHPHRRLIKVLGPPDGKSPLTRQIETCKIDLKEKYSGPMRGKSFVNSCGLSFVWIDKGSFVMGSSSSEKGHQNTEEPQRKVSVESSFWICSYEVSQDSYEKIVKKNPSHFQDSLRPVDSVSYKDAVEFCELLTEKEKKAGLIGSGQKYSLPSEAQWEYVCRGGTQTVFSFGDTLSSKDANFDGNYPYGSAKKGIFRKKTTLTGYFKPNKFGVYDMHGNLLEWVEDMWHDSYKGAPADEIAWFQDATNFGVLRGGAYSASASDCRSASRSKFSVETARKSFGFRLILRGR